MAFAEGSKDMLRDDELKEKKKVGQIEAERSNAQKDVLRSKLSLSNAEADKLAREQSKNKLLTYGWKMAGNLNMMLHCSSYLTE